MTKAEHTPGPWKYFETDNGFSICQHTPKADYHLAEIEGLDDQAKADARLIAAAPDLLLALKAVVAAADTYTSEMAEAAIQNGWADADTTIVVNPNPVISACRTIIAYVEATQ